MSSSKWFRIACMSAAAFALGTAAITSVSAQDATQEPTQDMTMSNTIMSNMTMKDGACPQGVAATWLGQMSSMMGTAEPGMTSTMEATEDMSMMTPAATMDMSSMATMEATEDMGMTGTEEMMGVKCLVGQFSGTAEVPGPGDTDGMVFVLVSVDPSSGDICYEEAVSGITLPASATHIHVNAAGLSGDIVVPFPVAPDAEGNASGCTNANVTGLAQAIATNPAGYYVNVHTSDFPSGAVRAQLMSWDDAMTMMQSAGMDTSGMMTGTMEPGMMATADMSGMTTDEPGMMVTPEATTAG